MVWRATALLQRAPELAGPAETQPSPDRTVVLNVLSHGPGYELLSDGRSLLQSWPVAGGQTAGIVNREWPGELGRWVLAETERYAWEVWQPDTRVDRPLAHTFADGVVHRLFPAQPTVFRPGLLRPVPGVRSPSLRAALEARAAGGRCALVLHGFGAPLWGEVAPRLSARLPTLLVGHGTVRPLRQRLRQVRHPLTLPALLIEHARTRRQYAGLRAVTGPNATALAAARDLYRGPVHPLTMGCDFAFWTAPDAASRAAARAALEIADQRTVLLTAAFLRPIKQIDRLIEACLALGPRADYTLLVIGQGDAEYVAALRRLGRPLLADGRLRFEPYLEAEALRRRLWAADVFVCASRAEGASVAVMEALSCGLPVLSTPVGGTFELLQKQWAGAVLPAGAFAQWPAVLRAILDGQRPAPLGREVARAAFDWRNVAKRFVSILDAAVAPTPGRPPR